MEENGKLEGTVTLKVGGDQWLLPWGASAIRPSGSRQGKVAAFAEEHGMPVYRHERAYSFCVPGGVLATVQSINHADSFVQGYVAAQASVQAKINQETAVQLEKAELNAFRSRLCKGASRGCGGRLWRRNGRGSERN